MNVADTRTRRGDPVWSPASDPVWSPASDPVWSPASDPVWSPASDPVWSPASDPVWSPVAIGGGDVPVAEGNVAGGVVFDTGGHAGTGGRGNTGSGGHMETGGHMGPPLRTGGAMPNGVAGTDGHMGAPHPSELPNRRSIRLRGYDYSQAGCYFITICTQDRRHYFGEIVGGALHGRPPYNGGAMERAATWGERAATRGERAATRGRPYRPPHAMVETWLLKLADKFAYVAVGPYVVMPNHIHAIIRKTGDGGGVRVGDAVGWFKTMTTNEYIAGVKQGWYEPFAKRLWQRNYHEHIIRNGQSCRNIAQYIAENPARWGCDTLNSARIPAGVRGKRKEGG